MTELNKHYTENVIEVIELADGRKAQVQLIIDTDESRWMWTI